MGGGTVGLDRGLDGKLADVLANLERIRLAWKRRGVFYLFRSQAAPADSRAAAVAWPIIRSLRASASRAGGYLSAEDWIWMAGLQREQLEGLGEEFPDAYHVRNLQPLVQVYAGMTQAERAPSAESEGSGWADWTQATRGRISQLLSPGDPRRARLLFKWESSARPPRVLAYLGAPEGTLRPMELRLRPRKERRATPGDGGVRPSAMR